MHPVSLCCVVLCGAHLSPSLTPLLISTGGPQRTHGHRAAGLTWAPQTEMCSIECVSEREVSGAWVLLYITLRGDAREESTERVQKKRRKENIGIESHVMCSCGSVVEHCVSSAKGCGFNSQGTHMLIKKQCIACKSLWIKASAKCINVKLNVYMEFSRDIVILCLYARSHTLLNRKNVLGSI